MQLAIVAAGFSGGEADHLRRSMAAWKRRGGLEPFRERLAAGMQERGYAPEFVEQIFRQIQGFGEYGFPESHAASFALLVYVSAWLKCHEPAIFTAALLNSQPMGFYAPAQLVQMAQRQGVEVRPVDVNQSDWDCTLEPPLSGQAPALRLGLRLIKGLSQRAAQALVAQREGRPFASVADLDQRLQIERDDYEALAAADALHTIAGNRRRAYWAVSGTEKASPLFGRPVFNEAEPLLVAPGEGQSLVEDYASTGLSLRQHPLQLLRPRLRDKACNATELWGLPDGSPVYAVGLVITRQRPGSASNVTFVTLEDETGFINLVIWERLAERQRKTLLNASMLGVYGKTQKQDGVLHVIAERLEDRCELLVELQVSSRNFR